MTPFQHQEKIKAQIMGSYNIQKSEDDNDIEKAGEGSKGGKVIGHTKSGKPIYANFNHDSHKEFTSQDHMDASDAHMKREDGTENERDEASASHYRKTDEYKAELAERKKRAKGE